jgi:hypothetical protein
VSAPSRAAGAAFVAAALAAVGASIAACGVEGDLAPSPDAGSAPDADTDAEAGATASYPLLPYPPGPYRAGLGNVVPNVRVQGYALSRAQRDSTKLPFRDITLGEVRSDPACKCLVLLFNVAGEQCGYCVAASRTLAALVASDPSICALETYQYTYDALLPGEPQQPPTRADLDLATQAARQSYPVGLLTPDALLALGAGAYPGIPDHLVIRPSDMTMVGFQAGTGTNIAQTIRGLCTTPAEPVTTVTHVSTPRRITVDATHVYVADADLGIVRAPSDGGPVQVLVKPAASPDALVLDGARVLWATRDGGTTFEVGSVDRTGSDPVILATSSFGFRSIAVDSTDVYFTRDDGVIGRVPRAGGAVVPILTGEPGATSIQVDATDLYWVDDVAGAVVRAPKAGGARRVIVPVGAMEYGTRAKELVLEGDHVLFRANAPSVGEVYVVSKEGGSIQHAADVNAPSLALDLPGTDLVSASIEPATGAAVIGHSLPERRMANGTAFETITPGQNDVTSVAGDGVYIYWTSDPRNAPQTGVVKRVRR